VGVVADPVDGDADGGADVDESPGPSTGPGRRASEAGAAGGSPEGSPTTADVPASLSVLTDDAPTEDVAQRGRVPVPLLTTVSISLCVGFTVVFGIIPGPILDFAHQATLLFT
jgi:hypothetical protein